MNPARAEPIGWGIWCQIQGKGNTETTALEILKEYQEEKKKQEGQGNSHLIEKPEDWKYALAKFKVKTQPGKKKNVTEEAGIFTSSSEAAPKGLET